MNEKKSVILKHRIEDIFTRKGIFNQKIDLSIDDINRYDQIKNESIDFLYPGATVSFIIDFDNIDFKLIRNDQGDHLFGKKNLDFDVFMHTLSNSIIDMDKEFYVYSLDKLFSYHLYLYYQYKAIIHRSSLVFRTENKVGHHQTYLQQNIPVTIKNGQITSFFISLTNVTHFIKEQHYELSFHNLSKNETQILDVKEFVNTEGATDNLTLSDREKTILKHISDGHSSKEVGVLLEISVETVNRHKKNMIKKNGMRNIIQLASECIRRGII
ncbi:helix-turn-helix transcriptional regulator [Flammeovirga yaeyamensis]|uniref:Helix-turn-helix transcriptional regulator n=1 Tax=Flammeovirga yaeyamensis TaxID=367791 RepID=A0AAX1N575_9BACT|nr:helix-turn-helix transcriptional regulator [Flammeovirga yaeyamensis]MBB3698633.1 DNA-binding CsgD family transcriptional regulator [Flammeovirga yaeyamensis]NMF34020.1 helix-turn-helix transcriptional regulator [Flammeovirga yaeyamensis]QWG01008.1 helix-turn-helix transcriptional regulator [Flammeovirga yaeyamensis]